MAGELILFCYEAGPCGYEVYRQLTALGFDCEVVRSLVALRGEDRITAMTLLSELGDVSRFDSPRQLMAYLGLVPSEHSSGARRRQGGITRTGNGHVRRTLVESAWCYRFPARRTAHLERKAAAASERGQGDRLEGAAPLVRSLPASAAGGQEQQTGERRRGARVERLCLGHRMSGDGPDPAGPASRHGLVAIR